MGSANFADELKKFQENLKVPEDQRSPLPGLTALAEAIKELTANEKKALKAALGL